MPSRMTMSILVVPSWWQRQGTLLLLLLLLVRPATPFPLFHTGRRHSHSQLPYVSDGVARGSCLWAHQPSLDDDDESSTAGSTSLFLATCMPGVAPVLATEISDCGGTAVAAVGPAAVTFQADGSTALRTLLWARTPHRILELLATSSPTLQTRHDLYQFVYDTIPVPHVLGNGQGGVLTLCIVDTILQGSSLPTDLRHSHYTGLTVKNALVDACRNGHPDGIRPSVDRENPDVPLVVVVRGCRNDNSDETTVQVSVYRQIHGPSSLHKRGYRTGTAIHTAALKESLAAALLRQAGWHEACTAARQAQQPMPLLLDPMTGSGTLVVEAALMAANVAPHLLRLKTSQPSQPQLFAMHKTPPMVRWKDYQSLQTAVWPQLVQDAVVQAREGMTWLQQSSAQPRVYVNDWHDGALDLFHQAWAAAGLPTNLMHVTCGNAADWQPPSSAVPQGDDNNDPWTVVCNPPWGQRLDTDVQESWEALGTWIRRTCPADTQIWVLSGNPTNTRALRLQKAASFPVQVGTQKLRWLRYDWYGGGGGSSLSKEQSPSITKEQDHSNPPVRRFRSSQSNTPATTTTITTLGSISRRRNPGSSHRSRSHQGHGGGSKDARTQSHNKKKKKQTSSTATSKTNEWLI